MGNRYKFTIFLFLFFAFIDILPADQTPKTSIIIPCYHKHAPFLPNLLDKLAMQTFIPDEVVISLSEVDLVSDDLLMTLKNGIYPYELVLLETQEIKWCGQNRNLACSVATGDILICQDADDIPHPQKIEIIVYFFMNTDAVHILHRWYPSEKLLKRLSDQQNETPDFDYLDHYENIHDIPIFKINNFKDKYDFPFISTGYASIRKEVFDYVQWPDTQQAEDYKFTYDVIHLFQKTLYLNIPLMIYHQENSSSIL